MPVGVKVEGVRYIGVPHRTRGIHSMLHSAFAQAGEREKTLVELLEDNSFAFDAGGVTWRGRRLTNAQLERHLLVAIGSCSFDEPVESLRRL